MSTLSEILVFGFYEESSGETIGELWKVRQTFWKVAIFLQVIQCNWPEVQPQIVSVLLSGKKITFNQTFLFFIFDIAIRCKTFFKYPSQLWNIRRKSLSRASIFSFYYFFFNNVLNFRHSCICHNILKVCRIRDTNTEPSKSLILFALRSAAALIKFYDFLLKGGVYSEAKFMWNFFFFE